MRVKCWKCVLCEPDVTTALLKNETVQSTIPVWTKLLTSTRTSIGETLTTKQQMCDIDTRESLKTCEEWNECRLGKIYILSFNDFFSVVRANFPELGSWEPITLVSKTDF